METRQRGLLKFYRVTVLILIFSWLLWWLVPLPSLGQSEIAVKLAGFILLGAIFFTLGLIALFLYLRGKLSFDISSSLLLTPVFHFAALLAGSPEKYVSYGLPFIFLLIALFPEPFSNFAERILRAITVRANAREIAD